MVRGTFYEKNEPVCTVTGMYTTKAYLGILAVLAVIQQAPSHRQPMRMVQDNHCTVL
jgi:hypothetical protein